MEIIKESNRVRIINDKKENIAYVSFPQVSENTVVIQKTFVSESLRGMGIASKLMELAYDVIKESNQKAEIECSYALKWFDNHPSKCDIIK